MAVVLITGHQLTVQVEKDAALIHSMAVAKTTRIQQEVQISKVVKLQVSDMNLICLFVTQNDISFIFLLH